MLGLMSEEGEATFRDIKACSAYYATKSSRGLANTVFLLDLHSKNMFRSPTWFFWTGRKQKGMHSSWDCGGRSRANNQRRMWYCNPWINQKTTTHFFLLSKTHLQVLKTYPLFSKHKDLAVLMVCNHLKYLLFLKPLKERKKSVTKTVTKAKCMSYSSTSFREPTRLWFSSFVRWWIRCEGGGKYFVTQKES